MNSQAHPLEQIAVTPRGTDLIGAGHSRGGATLDEVAAALGISRARAGQLEASALRKCRRWLSRNGYKPEDFFGPAEGGMDAPEWLDGGP